MFLCYSFLDLKDEYYSVPIATEHKLFLHIFVEGEPLSVHLFP